MSLIVAVLAPAPGGNVGETGLALADPERGNAGEVGLAMARPSCRLAVEAAAAGVDLRHSHPDLGGSTSGDKQSGGEPIEDGLVERDAAESAGEGELAKGERGRVGEASVDKEGEGRGGCDMVGARRNSKNGDCSEKGINKEMGGKEVERRARVGGFEERPLTFRWCEWRSICIHAAVGGGPVPKFDAGAAGSGLAGASVEIGETGPPWLTARD